MPRSVIDLGGPDWQVRGYLGEEWRWLDLARPPRASHDWLPATVPGAVVADLHAAGEVPDPYLDRNTLAIEWVADRAWVYRREFRLAMPEAAGDAAATDAAGSDPATRDPVARDTVRASDRAFLRLEGLETNAHVYLDGVLLGEHDSPTRPALFEVTEALRRRPRGDATGRDAGDQGAAVDQATAAGGAADPDCHVLAVVLDPSPHEQSQMGRTSLVRRHRGRMREGWDFCPRFPEAGISGQVAIELTGPVRIESVAVRPHLDGGLRHATVELEATLDGADDVDIEWSIEAPDGSATQCTERLRLAGRSTAVRSFVLEQPELWWPNGLGMRALYRARVVVRPAGEAAIADGRTLEFGLRSVELVPNADAPAEALPYTLRVNGRRVYMRGWNWVPDDVMPGVERAGRLESLLRLARDSGANLLRVWGGGRIESEAFYRLCDRFGLLVWQEFLLSSAGQDNEPAADPAYLAELVREAEAAVRSRAHHASLAIWCAGNELSRGPGRQPLDEDTSPAILALRDVVRRLDPERPWLPTSPSGPTFMRDTPGARRDDLHDVHGPWQHQGLGRQERAVLEPPPLLHSEFGAGSLADVRSIEATISGPHLATPTRADPVWRHRGAWWVCDELVRAAFDGAEHNPADAVGGLEGLEWASQYLQAQALRGWIEANRRAWPHNSGSIPWQFDESYPSGYGTNAVDWFGRPKAAYWAVRRAYAAYLVSARFEREAWAGRDTFEAELWLTTDEAQQIDGDLEAQLLDARGCSIRAIRQPLRCWLDRSAVVAAFTAPLVGVRGAFALDVSFRSHGRVLAANRYLFSAEATLAPLADAQRDAAAVSVALVPRPAGRTAVSAVNRSRGVIPLVRLDRALEAAGLAVDRAALSDDCFPLLAGEHRLIPLRGRGAVGATKPAHAADPRVVDSV